jgi:phosphopantetheinyl transferase (holo-ACP synthase)
MFLGLGIDLVSISQIAESVKSDSFRRKVFMPFEIEICESFTKQVHLMFKSAVRQKKSSHP